MVIMGCAGGKISMAAVSVKRCMFGIRTMKFSCFGNKALFLCKRFLLFMTANMAAVKTCYFWI